MCHPGRPRPHGRLPRRVLAFLARLPEGEVARILLERVRLLLLDLIRALPREISVLREARHAVVDVPFDRVRVALRDQLLDERDDLGDRVRGKGHLVRHPEPEVARVLQVPGRRIARELRAPPRCGVVDLVVDVRDVVDERHRISELAQPARQPGEDDERSRITDVRALVHRRSAGVDPDRLRWRRQLDE